jgi:hypothetical protein
VFNWRLASSSIHFLDTHSASSQINRVTKNLFSSLLLSQGSSSDKLTAVHFLQNDNYSAGGFFVTGRWRRLDCLPLSRKQLLDNNCSWLK